MSKIIWQGPEHSNAEDDTEDQARIVLTSSDEVQHPLPTSNQINFAFVVEVTYKDFMGATCWRPLTPFYIKEDEHGADTCNDYNLWLAIVSRALRDLVDS